jgi:hypothetical protein
MISTQKKEIRLILVLFLVGVACLSFYVILIGIERHHIYRMNDQILYIHSARNLLYDGNLTQGILYPSVLLQNTPHSYFYMPGHALSIALFLWLMGDGVWASIMPNILSYMASILLLYLIGRRLTNQEVGFMAGMLFAIFPINVVFAVSALSEMTLVCAGLIAFTAFLCLPSTFRPWLGPVLVCLPFLIRETGALWMIPMAAIINSDAHDQHRRQHALALVALSMLLLFCVLQIPPIRERPSLFLHNLLGATFEEKYLDAFFSVNHGLPRSVEQWYDLINARSLLQIKQLWWELNKGNLALHLAFWTPILAVAALPWLPRFRNLAAAYILMVLALFVFLTVLYEWIGFTGARLTLMLFPFSAIIFSCLIAQSFRTIPQRTAVISLLAALSLPVLTAQANALKSADQAMDWFSSTLRTIAEPDGLLISSWHWGLPYLYENYPGKPVSWAFVPANQQTLDLLQAKHPIHAAILDHADQRRLGRAALERIGLVRSTEVIAPDGSTYTVFTRPAVDAPRLPLSRVIGDQEAARRASNHSGGD